jgi:hypothetical protein
MAEKQTAKWYERKDGVQFRIFDEKTKARLDLDPDFKSIAAPKGKGKAEAAGSEREQLGDKLEEAEKVEVEVEDVIREDAAKANAEAEDIKEAEEEKKGVSKNVALTTDKRVKKG